MVQTVGVKGIKKHSLSRFVAKNLCRLARMRRAF